MKQSIRSLLAENPIVAAVKDEAQLREAVTSGCGVIFLLFGDILHIAEMVRLVKEADKVAVVHLDLIHGLATRISLWSSSRKTP
jgi:glycerol uptake operon antiterminator